MSKAKRREEEEILKKMFEEDDSSAQAKNADDVPPSAEEKRTDDIPRGSRGENDVIRCPRCGCVLTERAPCKKCGYNGYIPMTKAETRKIKLILYPIVLVIAILFILWKNGVFG